MAERPFVTRFAPSPTGPLHLGHAHSALTAFELAQAAGGQFLLRLEDIDRARCRPEYEAGIFEDLHWLGLDWPAPVLRQSSRQPAYAAALARLEALGVTYRCSCTRADIRAALAAPQEGAPLIGPDGPLYPGTCRHRALRDPEAAIRLDIARAAALAGPLAFTEVGPVHPGQHSYLPEWFAVHIGDVVLARRDIGVAYHLAVTVDDAEQEVSLVVRGADLFEATPIHRLLQTLLGFPEPAYHHHALVRDEEGKRLAKRDDARALALFRSEGETPAMIRARIAAGLKA